MKLLVVKYILPTIFILIAMAGVSHLLTELVRGLSPEFDLQFIEIKGSPAVAEKGRHLFMIRGCADCHGEDAGGKVFIDDPLMGTIAGSNLTKGAGGVAEDYKTIKDWHRAIRYGLKSNGHPLMFMPSYEYATLTKNDTAALILYLYNLPPVNRTVPKTTPGLLPRMLYLAGQMPILFPYSSVESNRVQVEGVDESVSVGYGKYLAETCTGCHGTNMRGGRVKGAPLNWPKASDLTKSGVLTSYTNNDFRSTLRFGKKKSGEVIDPKHMPWPSLSQMSDNEIDSIYLYLQSL